MSRNPANTHTSRLFTGVRVLLACFLSVGIWKATSSLIHKNSATLPAPPAKTDPLATPVPAPPKDKNTLLADAVEAEDVVAVKAILEKGANPNKVNQYNLLEFAAGEGNLQIVKLLLQYGAEVNPKRGHLSPLGQAARNGDLKMATLLLRYGAEVNPTPKRSCSPLAWASYDYSNGLSMMKLLIRHGADVNARFESGATVMTIAQYHSGDEAVALLKRHGARR